MKTVAIPLPWPPRVLSPNARVTWQAQITPRKAYRRDAWVLTRALAGKGHPDYPPSVAIEFRPPDNRARDLDNMIASFKAAQDGIADAVQANDSTFRPTYTVGATHPPNGCVIVTLTWGGA